MKKNNRIWLFISVAILFSLQLISGCKKETVSIAPSLATSNASAIIQTSATSGGNITSDGGSTITARGVCWSTAATPTIADAKTNDGVGTGSFTSSITGLAANTTYNIRAYATNSAGTGYGSTVSFTTTSFPVPELTTTAISDITLTTSKSGGNVTSDHGFTVTARGVCWSTGPTPTVTDNKTTDGSGTGSFISSVSGLLSNTTYNVRAYATTSAGTGYGNVLSFTTLQLPALTTSIVSNISITTATVGGNVTSAGSSAVTARGVCWSTSSAPTATGSKTIDGAGTGSFVSSLTGLAGNTKYYVRAYATNGAGTVYGDEVTFTTFGIIDMDGNGYHSVIIGAQEWMMENLKTKTYRDGSAIPNVTIATDWINLTTGAYSDFDNNINNVAIYGRLYNWYTVNDAHQLCPTGWHIPDDTEWDVLVTTLGGADVAGGKMKSTGTLQDGNGQWYSPNTGATNESKFTGLPAGNRGDSGAFGDIHSYGQWWSSIGDINGGYFRRLQDSHTKLERFSNSSKNGKSVRCVKD